MRRTGFTLIELLVVIAIIAILAAILFPVYLSAKDKARTATCQAHIKELGQAILIYASDNSQCFPPFEYFEGDKEIWWERRWDWIIFKYVKNEKIYQCPSHTADKSVSSYSINFLLTARGYPTTAKGIPIGDVRRTTRVVMLCDGNTERWERPIGRGNGITCFYAVGATGGPYTTGRRHGGSYSDKTTGTAQAGSGDNFCMVDGHVKWCEIESLKDQELHAVFNWRGISFDPNY